MLGLEAAALSQLGGELEHTRPGSLFENASTSIDAAMRGGTSASESHTPFRNHPSLLLLPIFRIRRKPAVL